MHAIRRRAKYAAWYDDPTDEPRLLKNPFARIRLHNLKPEATPRRAPKVAGASPSNKEVDHPERSALDLPPASGTKTESFDETNELGDIESTSGKWYHLRHSPLRQVASFLHVVGKFFRSADTSENQSATLSSRALRLAAIVFEKKVKPRIILSELTFVRVTQDSSGSNDNLLEQSSNEAQVAISSIQSAQNIDLEIIRVSH